MNSGTNKSSKDYSQTSKSGANIEDKIKIKTSPASAITLHCEGRHGQFKASRTETYTYAEFDYIPEKLGSYFRIEVRDSQGYKAYSNAYFIDDIQKRKDNE